MPALRVSVVLPYYLRLAVGDFVAADGEQSLRIGAAILEEGLPPRTPVDAQFHPADSADPDEIQRSRTQCAEQLLRRINRLLRWYRTISRRADITEVTRGQASPFRFAPLGVVVAADWIAPLAYEAAGPQPLALTLEDTTAAVLNGYSSGNEPDVAELFLLDAERAIHQGRFRESVLFCWSTIDTVFNRRYDELANAALAGEWAEARAFFTGFDFGLRTKMSAGMHLFAQRSLFREPDGFWKRLSNSYAKRNAIIHAGDSATETDATTALEVAQRIVAIMNEI